MNYLINPLLELDIYNEILGLLKAYKNPISITGPSDSQKAHISYALCTHCGTKGIYIAFNEMQARKMYDDFSFFLGEDALFFPAKEIMLHDIEAKSYDAVFQRIRALDRLLNGDFKAVITSAEALMQKLMPVELFKASILTFISGQTLELSELPQKLVAMGYERVSIVEGKGQFSIRGGIIDIFSIDSDNAVRIELFDDEVDSIRTFDIMSQRSVENIAAARIIPAREVIYSPEARQCIINKIESSLQAHMSRLKKTSEYAQALEERIISDIQRLKSDYYFAGIDKLIPFIFENAANIIDYACYGGNTLTFIDERLRVRQRVENVLLELHESCKTLAEKGQILPESYNLHFDFEALSSRLDDSKVVYLSTIAGSMQNHKQHRSYNMTSKLLGSYQGHFDLLVEDIRHWKEKGSRIIILSGTRGKGQRVTENLAAQDVEAVYIDELEKDLRPGQVVVSRGNLNKGFEYPAIGLVIVSDMEVCGKATKRKKAWGKNEGSKLKAFTDLNPGDYVVHQAHGIGQYVGIQKLVVQNIKKDYLKIRYQDEGYIYIPTNQLEMVQKYIGTEGKQPKLSKLGGTDWLKTKNRVKESLRELAGELIKLYANRRTLKGHAFSSDTVWQNQFEELFPYEETDDQLRCIEEIKRDMESDRPMDRLLCGDVGYGKTEVAIRAIFKSVMDGKQVAYLVPTTILAQQHYNNFKQRMKDFPVTVEVISRFRSPAEQKKVLKDVKAGNVDILVGTHRLLQKDIQFKDLGLLVVDEEQRFGVTHKEKLKNLKSNVDTLTLTATPIPRTLHMSLVGIRDISLLEDPPEERYPVQTYVMEYNPQVIRDTIIREISRKGQVFFLYNRVRTIHLKAAEIQALVPEARVEIAHGQMDETQLENIMNNFINGEYDILICTTIIESGLDMPNVNTIIVEDADKMGLAQLYQLRGRVGRSNRLAYAYITYKKDKVLAEAAEKRLQAIKEFTEFGSGFKIAMRDLEIRGAGNLLGPEQHGHMDTVGYDMYCRLLDEAVREQSGESLGSEQLEVSIDINVNAYIHDAYISTENQKIEMYKRIASIQDEQDAIDVEDELMDRYGDLPGPVKNLIQIAYIKTLARECGFTSIQEKSAALVLQYKSDKYVNINAMGRLMDKYKRSLLFTASSTPYLTYKTQGINRDQFVENIKILLQDIKKLKCGT